MVNGTKLSKCEQGKITALKRVGKSQRAISKAFERSKSLSLTPTRQDLTQCQWPEGRLKVGIRGGENRAQAEAQTLPDITGHRPT